MDTAAFVHVRAFCVEPPVLVSSDGDWHYATYFTEYSKRTLSGCIVDGIRARRVRVPIVSGGQPEQRFSGARLRRLIETGELADGTSLERARELLGDVSAERPNVHEVYWFFPSRDALAPFAYLSAVKRDTGLSAWRVHEVPAVKRAPNK